MKIRSEASVFSSTGILQVLLIAVLYGSLICFFKEELDVFGNIEIRVGTFVPAIGGLLFGMPGAIGAFLGNAVSYVIYDTNHLFNIICSFYNFIIAYGVFRLWYAGNSSRAVYYLNDSRSLSKILRIFLFNAINMSVLLAGITGYLAFGSTSMPKMFVTFANNIDYPLIFGIPVVWAWGSIIKTRFVRFRDNDKNCLTAQNLADRLGIDIVFDAGTRVGMHIALIGLEMGFVFQVYCDSINDYFAWLALILGTIIWFLLILQPSTYEPTEIEKRGYRFIFGTLNNRMLIASSIILIMLVSQDVLYFMDDLMFKHNPTVWLILYLYVSVYLIAQTFTVHMVFSKIEKKAIKKWRMVMMTAGRYSEASGTISQDDHQNLSDISQNESKDFIDEIDILQINITIMEKNIQDNMDKLSATLRERQSMEAQLNVANDIQQGVLPDLSVLQDILQKDGYAVYGGMRAAKFVGGDMYNCVQLDADHVLIMVADVAGKGVPGALFMMVTQAVIKQNAKDCGLVPGDIIAATNDTLSMRNRESLFVTMWLGILELSTGRLRYTNAGHNPPILVYDGKADWIRELSGPVLGLMDGMEYKTYEMQLPLNSKLLLYTDGINEAENGKGGFYGNDRLESAFTASASPRDLIDDIQGFVDGAPQSDDMTYLWIERRPISNAELEGGGR